MYLNTLASTTTAWHFTFFFRQQRDFQCLRRCCSSLHPLVRKLKFPLDLFLLGWITVLWTVLHHYHLPWNLNVRPWLGKAVFPLISLFLSLLGSDGKLGWSCPRTHHGFSLPRARVAAGWTELATRQRKRTSISLLPLHLISHKQRWEVMPQHIVCNMLSWP